MKWLSIATGTTLLHEHIDTLIHSFIHTTLTLHSTATLTLFFRMISTFWKEGFFLNQKHPFEPNPEFC